LNFFRAVNREQISKNSFKVKKVESNKIIQKEKAENKNVKNTRIFFRKKIFLKFSFNIGIDCHKRIFQSMQSIFNSIVYCYVFSKHSMPNMRLILVELFE
jgi:hypothetical protein